MHVVNLGRGFVQETMNKELEGWEVDLNSCLLLMMTSMKTLMNDVHWDRWESRLFSTQRPSSCSSLTNEAVSQVKKESAILKRALTERQERWPKKGVVLQNQVTLAPTCWERGWTKLA